MTFPSERFGWSDDCGSNIHDMCSGKCLCPCHGHNFSMEEIRALYEHLKNEYVSYEEPLLIETVNKIVRIISEHELVTGTNRPTQGT